MINKPKRFRNNVNNNIKLDVSSMFANLEESRRISTELLNGH